MFGYEIIIFNNLLLIAVSQIGLLLLLWSCNIIVDLLLLWPHCYYSGLIVAMVISMLLWFCCFLAIVMAYSQLTTPPVSPLCQTWYMGRWTWPVLPPTTLPGDTHLSARRPPEFRFLDWMWDLRIPSLSALNGGVSSLRFIFYWTKMRVCWRVSMTRLSFEVFRL